MFLDDSTARMYNCIGTNKAIIVEWMYNPWFHISRNDPVDAGHLTVLLTTSQLTDWRLCYVCRMPSTESLFYYSITHTRHNERTRCWLSSVIVFTLLLLCHFYTRPTLLPLCGNLLQTKTVITGLISFIDQTEETTCLH